jgi:hypothetical protein
MKCGGAKDRMKGLIGQAHVKRQPSATSALVCVSPATRIPAGNGMGACSH